MRMYNRNVAYSTTIYIAYMVSLQKKVLLRGGRNRIGRREKWPKKSWEEGEIGGKSREEGEKET